MRRKMIAYCEACGADRPGGDGFVIFHYLAFCSADCRDEYRKADEGRREQHAQQQRTSA
jgi:hypothetical protein